MAIRTDTIYHVREEDPLGNPAEPTNIAVTDDEEGMYWYDSVEELIEDRGDDRTRHQHLTPEELDTLRYGPKE